MKTFKDFINEDGMVGGVPANNVGGGEIAGLGINNPNNPNQAEPGVNKKKKKTPLTFKDLFKRRLPQ